MESGSSAGRADSSGILPHEHVPCCQLPQVKQRFYEAFKGDGYPEAFIYRQRVIVLFQKIDGVDVALYCMYVQEYGQDCPPPNRNVVYLSYIDR